MIRSKQWAAGCLDRLIDLGLGLNKPTYMYTGYGPLLGWALGRCRFRPSPEPALHVRRRRLPAAAAASTLTKQEQQR